MTTAPFVELRFNPTDLRPRDLPTSGAWLGTPADALEASLAVARAAMVDQMKSEVRGLGSPTSAQLLRIADLTWQATFWRYRKVSAPIMADAYVRAYRAAEAGDVPMSIIYDLADKHAEKIGDYFHESSRAALADGFNTLVNKRVPAKAAADRVLDAYGLTQRQMRTYVGASQFDTPISDVMPRSLKAKARAYIDKAFTTRIRKLSQQEEHNIDEQAKQFAWMWLQDKGRLNEKALKLWITARDERVCEICGPLHNKRVPVNEQFRTVHGDFWTPGLHPNCRCVVRLLEMKFSKSLAGVELEHFNLLHPRDDEGRFGVKTRTKTSVDREFKRITAGVRTHDPLLEAQFVDILQGGIIATPKVRGRTKPKQAVIAPTAAERQAMVATPRATIKPKVAHITAQRAEIKADVEAATKPITKPQGKLKPLPDTSVKVKQGTKIGGKLKGLAFQVTYPHQHDPKDPRKIQPTTEYYGSEGEAAEAASNEIRERVDRATKELKQKGGTFRLPVRGTWYALTGPQLEQVVEGYARRASSQSEWDPDPVPHLEEDMLPVQQIDDEGIPIRGERGGVTEEFSVSFIAGALNLDKYDFDVKITSSHASQLPKTGEIPGHQKIDVKGVRYTKDQDFPVAIVPVTPLRRDPTPQEAMDYLKNLGKKKPD